MLITRMSELGQFETFSSGLKRVRYAPKSGHYQGKSLGQPLQFYDAVRNLGLTHILINNDCSGAWNR